MPLETGSFQDVRYETHKYPFVVKLASERRFAGECSTLRFLFFEQILILVRTFNDELFNDEMFSLLSI